MEFVYLTVDDVIDLQAEAIDQFGGLDGLRSNDLLESAVYRWAKPPTVSSCDQRSQLLSPNPKTRYQKSLHILWI